MVIRALICVLVLVLLGSVDAATYKGVPQDSTYTCSGRYWVELSCFARGDSSYGCFDTISALSCCGCTGGVCYACKRSTHCPATLGKGCKLTSLPTGILVIMIVMPIFVFGVITTVLVCSCIRTNRRRMAIAAIGTQSTPYVVSTTTPQPTYSHAADQNVVYETTTTTQEVEMFPIHHPPLAAVSPIYTYPQPQAPQHYVAPTQAPMGISTAYGGAGAGYEVSSSEPPPPAGGSSGHAY